MSIIEFPQEEILDLTDMPDVEDMDLDTLKSYRDQITAAIRQLDKAEPKNEQSEEYDQWAEDHEELEDILDEILDRMEDLGE